jgi:hypothetical protein
MTGEFDALPIRINTFVQLRVPSMGRGYTHVISRTPACRDGNIAAGV